MHGDLACRRGEIETIKPRLDRIERRLDRTDEPRDREREQMYFPPDASSFAGVAFPPPTVNNTVLNSEGGLAMCVHHERRCPANLICIDCVSDDGALITRRSTWN
jgi:hypothetical protein